MGDIRKDAAGLMLFVRKYVGNAMWVDALPDDVWCDLAKDLFEVVGKAIERRPLPLRIIFPIFMRMDSIIYRITRKPEDGRFDAEDLETANDLKRKALKALQERKALQEAEEGQVVYVVPWAVKKDDEGRLWLKGRFTFDLAPSGTVCLAVVRKGAIWLVDSSTASDYASYWEPAPTIQVGGKGWFPVQLTDSFPAPHDAFLGRDKGKGD